jgi:hypothetical protein
MSKVSKWLEVVRGLAARQEALGDEIHASQLGSFKVGGKMVAGVTHTPLSELLTRCISEVERLRVANHSPREFKSFIRTHLGHLIDPFDPDPTLIHLEDIAWSLSNICRFNGHSDFISVALHSINVAKVIEERFNGSKEQQLAGLLHDAAEAYLCDIPTPIKMRPEFAFYREAERRLQNMIYEKFGPVMDRDTEEMVEKADKTCLNYEIKKYMFREQFAFRLEEQEPFAAGFLDKAKALGARVT